MKSAQVGRFHPLVENENFMAPPVFRSDIFFIGDLVDGIDIGTNA